MPESFGSFDVAIAGAGIGGATLALLLAREGWNVAVLERDLVPHVLPRPEILWEPSLALLDAAGIGARIRRKSALAMRRLVVMDVGTGTRCLTFDEADFARAGTRAWASDPAATRAIILQAAVDTGHVSVLRGARVTGLVRKDARVRGVELMMGGREGTLDAPLVVGDDGPESVVRHAAGISMEAMAFPLTFVLASVPRPSNMPEAVGRAYIDPRHLREGVPAALVAPIARDRVGIVIGVQPRRYEELVADPDDFARHAAHLLFPFLEIDMPHPFPEAFTAVTPQFGHADAYSAPGVALLGDAAHPVSPVGGQGANMAIGDAVALAQTLLATTRPGQAPGRDALATFEAMRRGPNERSLALSQRTARGIETAWNSPWSARLLPVALRFFNDAPGRKARFLRRLSEPAISTLVPETAPEPG